MRRRSPTKKPLPLLAPSLFASVFRRLRDPFVLSAIAERVASFGTRTFARQWGPVARAFEEQPQDCF